MSVWFCVLQEEFIDALGKLIYDDEYEAYMVTTRVGALLCDRSQCSVSRGGGLCVSSGVIVAGASLVLMIVVCCL